MRKQEENDMVKAGLKQATKDSTDSNPKESKESLTFLEHTYTEPPLVDAPSRSTRFATHVIEKPTVKASETKTVPKFESKPKSKPPVLAALPNAAPSPEAPTQRSSVGARQEGSEFDLFLRFSIYYFHTKIIQRVYRTKKFH